MQKCIIAIFFKVFILLIFFSIGSIFSSHTIRHVFSPFYNRLERFRVPAEYITKIDMKYFAAFCYQYVIIMPIANAKYIRYYHITSAAPHIVIHCFSGYAMFVCVRWVVFSQVFLNCSMFGGQDV